MTKAVNWHMCCHVCTDLNHFSHHVGALRHAYGFVVVMVSSVTYVAQGNGFRLVIPSAYCRRQSSVYVVYINCLFRHNVLRNVRSEWGGEGLLKDIYSNVLVMSLAYVISAGAFCEWCWIARQASLVRLISDSITGHDMFIPGSTFVH